MNYLSIDFSTTATGYAYKQNGKYIVGVIKGGKGSAWERTAQIAETIKEMIIEDSLQNYHIVIEQPKLQHLKSFLFTFQYISKHCIESIYHEVSSNSND
jgi:hypothetical protein